MNTSFVQHLKQLTLMGAVALLTACAHGPVQLGGSIQATAPENSGRIIGSIGRAPGRTSLSQFEIKFRPKGSNDGQSGSEIVYAHDIGMPGGTGVDFNDRKNGAGSVFSAYLPPGEYELYGIRLFENLGSMTTTFHTKVDFSIPFTVAKGETVYLGAFLATTTKGKNLLGMSVPSGAYFLVSNQLQRDVGLLAKKQIVIPVDKVRVSLAASPDNPYIRPADTTDQ